MDQVHSQVVRLQNKTIDWLDNKSASSALALLAEIQRLEDDAQVKKSSHNLIERIKSILRLLHQAAEQGSIDQRHEDELADQFEDLMNQLKKL